MSVSYDFIAEDRSFDGLAKADEMKKSKNPFASYAGKLYYIFLEFYFFWNLYSLGQGNIYIDTGKPIPVEPNASKKALAQRAQEEAARCYRVTMPALVSYAIHKGGTSREQLQKSVERYSEMLKAANINFQPSTNLKESIEGALRGLILTSTRRSSAGCWRVHHRRRLRMWSMRPAIRWGGARGNGWSGIPTC